METTDTNPAKNLKPIRILPPETAKRIAAGEVIERPQSVVRELLDNSIDAQATAIRVELCGGGLDSLLVRDNGVGMDKSDLLLSIHPHATSKIEKLDDLLSLHSLGFRGEALASIAAVADVTMRSASQDDDAWELSAGPGREPSLIPSRGSRGTSVEVRNLFASFPARKQFMQRASAESLACRQIFIDKSLPFPETEFRLSMDGKPSLILLPDSLTKRVRQASLAEESPALFRELLADGQGFSARLVAGEPGLHRRDRRYLQVFVNKRRVQEYKLQQALEYAYREVMPGGMFPLVYAFIEVDPALADFNIHPAKKEVRLRNSDDIRQALIRCLKDYLGNSWRLNAATAREQAPVLFDTRPTTSGNNTAWVQAVQNARQHSGNTIRDALAAIQPTQLAPLQADSVAENPPPTPQGDSADRQMPAPDKLHYLGQSLGTFLVFEYDNSLFILDQHAAHERILYNTLSEQQAATQELLVPYVYEAQNDEEDQLLASLQSELASQGFRLQRDGTSWVLDSLPTLLASDQGGLLFEALRKGGTAGSILSELKAQIACKAAVKDGDTLDSHAAIRLAQAALALPEARCPHGRPIWLRLSRDQLFTAVGRTV